MNGWVACIALVASSGLVSGVAAAQTASSDSDAAVARRTVEQLNAGLLQAMAGGEALGYAGRVALLGPIIDQSFDLPFIARMSLGRHRHSLSEEDAARWLAVYRRFTISIYAERFSGNSVPRFEILSVQPARRQTYIVWNQLVRSGEHDAVRIDYRLRRSGDGAWRIIDVYLDGKVSELALRRSEYSAVVEREGFASLVSSLEEKLPTAPKGAESQ